MIRKSRRETVWLCHGENREDSTLYRGSILEEEIEYCVLCISE